MPVRWNPFTNNFDMVSSPSGSTPVIALTGDTGTAVPDADDKIKIEGGGGITVTASASKVAVAITSPLDVQYGGSGLDTITDGGIMLGSDTGAVTVTAQPGNGQLLIGSVGSDPVLAQLTAGQGMTITNVAGGITVAGTDANNTNKGVATFDEYDFVVNSGNVTQRPVVQVVYVGEHGNDGADGRTLSSAKRTIQGAINSVIDATSSKVYVVLIYPGTYIEDIYMKAYVSLKGIGQPTSVIISGTNSAPLLTFDTDSSRSFVENIRLSIDPTTDAQSLVTMTNGIHKFEGCAFRIVSATQDIGATVINQSGGTLYVDNSNLTYTMSATASTAAKEHVIFGLSGTHTTKVSGLVRTAITIADTDDNFIFVKEAGTTTALELRDIDSDVTTSNAAHTGTVSFLNTTAVGVAHTREISGCAIDFIQSAGTPNNFCYPYIIDSTSNAGVIHSSGNLIHADGYGTSTFATIATGDEILSHFDDIDTDTASTGAGTFTKVFSHENGTLDLASVNLTECICLDKDLETMAAGALASGYRAIVDASDTTGGNAHVVDVSLTAPSGGAAVVAMGTSTGVDVIHQHIGGVVTADKCWSVDSTVWTDRTVAFGAPGTDVQIFAADNDVIYIGDVAVFDKINFAANTVASVDLKPTFEYWNGAWTSFTPVDNTSGFSSNGEIEIPDLTGDWATTQVNAEGDGPWYYVRMTRTKNHVVTAPTEDTIKITADTLYEWDKVGDITTRRANIAGLDYPTADGNAGDVITTDAAGTLSFAAAGGSGGTPSASSFRNTIDFNAGVSSYVNWAISGITNCAYEIGHPGLVRLDVGAGYVVCSYFGTGDGDFDVITVAKYVSALASGDITIIGLHDSPTIVGSIANGIYFRAAFGDTNWMACTENGNTVTATDTGIVINNASWRNFKINVESIGTLAKFYIDGVLVATNNTNMPSVTLGMFCGVSVTSLPALTFYVDLIDVGQTLTGDRA